MQHGFQISPEKVSKVLPGKKVKLELTCFRDRTGDFGEIGALDFRWVGVWPDDLQQKPAEIFIIDASWRFSRVEKHAGLSAQGSWRFIAGWLFGTCFFLIFHIIWDVILPIDEVHHFSRWLKHAKTTKQIGYKCRCMALILTDLDRTGEEGKQETTWIIPVRGGPSYEVALGIGHHRSGNVMVCRIGQVSYHHESWW